MSPFWEVKHRGETRIRTIGRLGERVPQDSLPRIGRMSYAPRSWHVISYYRCPSLTARPQLWFASILRQGAAPDERGTEATSMMDGKIFLAPLPVRAATVGLGSVPRLGAVQWGHAKEVKRKCRQRAAISFSGFSAVVSSVR